MLYSVQTDNLPTHQVIGILLGLNGVLDYFHLAWLKLATLDEPL